MSSSGASCAAAAAGALICCGFANTLEASSDTASSVPLRSVIVPRRAVTWRSSTCCSTARSLSDPARTVPSHVARIAARPSRTTNRANSSPIRRSTIVTA